jgi:hypothetical protein
LNSRAKGCRGERECRDWFRAHGFLKAYRTQQYCGASRTGDGGGACDVTIPELPSIHVEVKRVEKGNPYDWIEQAMHDVASKPENGGKIPVVWHKRNNRPALIIMAADHWMEIVRETDRIK